jgi:hypothetical protein
LNNVFNNSFLQGIFPTQRKQAAVVSVLNKGYCALIVNYRPITILNNFFSIFESIIHDTISFYF